MSVIGGEMPKICEGETSYIQKAVFILFIYLLTAIRKIMVKKNNFWWVQSLKFKLPIIIYM